MADRAFRNTKAYTVDVSLDGETWTQIDNVTDNTENYTERSYDTPIEARYVRVTVTEPNQNGEADPRARISEIELFEDANTDSVFYPKNDKIQETQKLAEAELTTEMEIDKVPVSVNTWMSATENVMVTSVRSEGTKTLELDISAWTKQDGSQNYKKDSGAEEDYVWASRTTYNAAKDNEDSWTSEAVIASKVIGKESETAKTDVNESEIGVVLEPGEEIYIVTAVGGGGQTYDNQDQLQTEDPLAEAEALLGQFSTEEELQALWEDHCQWWKDYWLKSYIDIGDEDYHRYYYGSLYYMGCAAREDTQAPGQYGIWITTDRAFYQGDYHMNYNFMAPFYGMYSSNRYEGAYSLTQPILDYMPKAEKAAKENLWDVAYDYVAGREDLADGIDDAVLYPVGLGPWGTYTESTYLNQTLNGLFAATVFMSYYNYTQDEEFLQNEAYPFLRKVANFYLQWREKEDLGNGEYRYNIWDGAHEGSFNKNAGVTVGIAKSVFGFLLDQAELVQASEDEKAQWQDMYDHIADVPVRTYTDWDFSKDVFALSEDGEILRPAAATVELEFIQPGDGLSFDSDPELLEIGRNTIEAKVYANSEVWGNINNNPKMFTHAIRVGYDPVEVMKQFKLYNIDQMEKNFMVQDGHHGIEKAGAIEFINNMLLQSSEGIIKVFPNWTGGNAQFTTLREKGAYLVSSKMQDGEVQYIEVTSEKGNDVEIVNPWENAAVYDGKGNLVKAAEGTTVNTGETTLTFAAEAGETYVIQKAEDTPEEPDTADKTALNMVIAMAEKMEAEQAETGCYTKETWAAVQTALDAARALASDESASQEDVDSAFLELITAVNLLENAVQSVGLQAAIEGAKAILADVEGLEQYTPESVEALRTALVEAEKVYAEESADQETINAAARMLMDAVTSLVVVDVDTRLDILIQKAEELLADSDQYTSASIANLQAALDAAKLVAEDRDATDEVINEAYSALAEAMTSLIRKADKSELKTALDKAAAILADSGRYVEDTIAGLQAAADAAQAVYDKEDATTAEVGEAVKSLVDEILKARLLGDVDGDGAVDSADSAEVLKYAAEAQELDEVQNKAADVNQDGVADSTDAAVILEYAAEQYSTIQDEKSL